MNLFQPFRRQIHEEILINKSIGAVWAALADLANYHLWNSFIPKASGTVEEGNQLDITIHVPGKSAEPYQVTLTEVRHPRILRWLGHFKIRGLCDGDHVFELVEVNDTCTKLIHRETFQGLLVPIIWPDFGKRFLQAFRDVNSGLKRYLEGPASP